MPFSLLTQRLRLREMEAEDLDFVSTMLGDERVMRFYPKALSRRESLEWIGRQRERYRTDGHGLWLAIERATGEPVGQVGLVEQAVEGVVETEVGYLLHAPFWHRGFATEAGLAVRRYAFESLGRSCVIALIRPPNLPSQAVARRLGMAPVREVTFKGLSHVVYSVGRESVDREG